MGTSEASATLLAADSFRVRVRAGVAEVRGFEAHLDRFRRGVEAALYPSAAAAHAGDDAQGIRLAEAALRAMLDPAAEPSAAPSSTLTWESPLSDHEQKQLDSFIEDSRDAIHRFGEGFPRLELWRDADGSPRLECALRPLPQLTDSLALRSSIAEPGPFARVKGPNIARYAALNRSLGAEALLVGSGGLVREGATTSLLFWTDERDDSGHFIDLTERVSSVTEGILRAAADQRLVGTKPARTRSGRLHGATPTVAELQGCEVWTLNALHGIRPATHIDGLALPAFDPARLQWFREALDRSWEPVAGIAAS